jgi:hypothetical protein
MRCLGWQKASTLFLLMLGMVAQGVCGAEDPPAQDQPPAAPQPPNQSEQTHQDFSEKYQLRVLTNAPPVAGAASSSTNASKEGFHWDFSWNGWDGLQVGFSRRTRFRTPRELLGLQPLNTNLPTLHFEQLKMSAQIGGVTEVDGAALCHKWKPGSGK